MADADDGNLKEYPEFPGEKLSKRHAVMLVPAQLLPHAR